MTNQFWCGAHCYYLHNLKITPKYLYYALKSQEDRIMSLRTGAAMPNIKKSALGEFVFNIDDDSSTQNKVVNVLDNISEMLNKKNQQLSEYDQLIKSRFVEMFGTIENTNHRVDTLMNLSEFITDGTHQTPHYTDDKVRGYKFLSSKDVTSGKIDWSNIKYIPEELHNELYNRIAPRKNDILLAKNGTTGTAALVDVDEVFDIYVSLAIIRLKDNTTNPTYILHAINSIDTKRQFNASLKGVGVPNLHLGEIRKAKIIVPDIELQDEFVETVKQIDKLKFEVQKSLDETQMLFDSLMQEYFG
jgi:type I restriction enzyme S subunit